MHINYLVPIYLRYSLSFSTLQPSTFKVLFMVYILVRASSSVGALNKRSGNEHHVIGSFSNDPYDEIILNEKNVGPGYSQTEDTATYEDFRLQGNMGNLREKRESHCKERTKSGYSSAGKLYHVCNDPCVCVGRSERRCEERCFGNCTARAP